MQRSTIDLLPQATREKIDRLLLEHNFSNYLELTERVNGLLAESGLEQQVSRTGLHRYGKTFQTRLEALRTSTQQAMEMKKLLGDDEAAVADMSLQLAQGLLFDLMLERGDELDPKEIGMITRALADASRAGIGVKKYQAEIKAKVEEKLSRLEGESQPGRSLDPETLARVREELYGLF